MIWAQMTWYEINSKYDLDLVIYSRETLPAEIHYKDDSMHLNEMLNEV